MIRFDAPLALLDTWTRDGRRLESGEDGAVRHREFPIPVRVLVGSVSVHLGRIESLDYDRGSRVLWASGVLDTAQETAASLAFLELDVDDVPDSAVSYQEPDVPCPLRPDLPGDLFPGPGGVSFGTWRVSGAVLGGNPAWDLPAARTDRAASDG